MTIKKQFRGRVSMELGAVTTHNVGQLKKVNSVVFPVAYNDKFYKEVVNSGELARLAYFNDTVVGGVCCRVDNTAPSGTTLQQQTNDTADTTDGATATAAADSSAAQLPAPKGKRLYIMTLGCLAPYRRLGMGKMMLQHVLDVCAKQKDINAVWLHVQVSNTDALDFYKSFGFRISATVPNYYKRIEPPDAYVLQKDLNDDAENNED